MRQKLFLLLIKTLFQSFTHQRCVLKSEAFITVSVVASGHSGPIIGNTTSATFLLDWLSNTQVKWWRRGPNIVRAFCITDSLSVMRRMFTLARVARLRDATQFLLGRTNPNKKPHSLQNVAEWKLSFCVLRQTRFLIVLYYTHSFVLCKKK